MTITAIPIRASTHDVVLELESHGSITDEWIYLDGRAVGYRGWRQEGTRWVKWLPVVGRRGELDVTLRCSGAEGSWCRLVVTIDDVPMEPALRAVVRGGTGRDVREYGIPV